MKRSPIHRKTPLRSKQSSKLVRRTPIERGSAGSECTCPVHGRQVKSGLNSVNPDRSKASRMRNFDGGIEHDTYIKQQPCDVCAHLGEEQQTPTQPCHRKARGMGGRNGNWTEQFPGCHAHHTEQGLIGIDGMKEKYGIDLAERSRHWTLKHVNEFVEARAIKEAA